MKRSRCLGSLTAMLAFTACDPLFSTQYRQPIAPITADQCVETALRSSPLVAIVSRDKDPDSRDVTSSYHIVVRDSATAGGEWDGQAAREQKGDSAWVRLSYQYMGFATPPRSDRARWESEAYEILESVRARCAPEAPSAVTCRAGGGLGGQRGACSTRS